MNHTQTWVVIGCLIERCKGDFLGQYQVCLIEINVEKTSLVRIIISIIYKRRCLICNGLRKGYSIVLGQKTFALFNRLFRVFILILTSLLVGNVCACRNVNKCIC